MDSTLSSTAATRRALLQRLAQQRTGGAPEPTAPTEVEAAAPSAVQSNPYGTTNTKGRAFELLRKGLRPMEVARALEVSPGLISQYMEDEEFKEGVRAGLALRSLARTARDEKIDSLEDAALAQLERVLPFVTKPMEALQAVKVLNSLQRRAEVDGGTGESAADVDTVILHLPKSVRTVAVAMKFNTSNEVVEVGGRELRTMQPTGVMGALESMRQERLEGRVEVENGDGITLAF